MQLGFGSIDNTITRFDPDDYVVPPEGIVGNSMPRVADWNANLSVTYTAPLSGAMDFVTRVSGNWLGERNFDLENLMVDDNAAYLNLSLGLEADAWMLQLRGTNLADRLEPEDAFYGIASTIARFRNTPRQVMAEFTYRFQ